MKPLALVVENDTGTRKLLDVLLSRFGLEVDLVATGSDALLLLEHVSYDVLFIDLLLPGTSGSDVLAWMTRERPELLARSIIISSSSPATLERVREQYPGVRTIRKPFELGEILETAQASLAGRTPHTPSLAETFCRHSVRGGAKSGVVVTRRGHVIEPLLWFGYGRDAVEEFFPMTIDADYPLCETMRKAQPTWLASIGRAAQEYPQLARVWDRNETRALATAPLLHEGRVIGAAGWSFREPRLFSEVEQTHFLAVAELMAESMRGADTSARPLEA